MVVFWFQDAVCWKCRDRIACPPNGDIWSWPHTKDVLAFWKKHKTCDDGESVGLYLEIADPDQTEMFTTKKVA